MSDSFQEVVMAFDLSTTCTGVVIAYFDGKDLIHLETTNVIPKDISPTKAGFLKAKQKTTTKTGETITSYVKYKGEKVSKTEKKRRDVLMKKLSEEHRLITTASGVRELIQKYNPTLILMEANMAFRNMDTTKKLAEVAGALQALAVATGVPLEKINVATARSHWNISKECIEYAKTLTPKELARMDLTKETLKNIMINTFKGYKLNKDMTTDESDALVLLYHWMTTQEKEIRR